MRVRATQMGYYKFKRRPEGSVFQLKPYKKQALVKDEETGKMVKRIVEVSAEAQFSKVWMEEVDAEENLVAVKPQKQFGPNIGKKQASDVARPIGSPDIEEDEEEQILDEDGELIEEKQPSLVNKLLGSKKDKKKPKKSKDKEVI